MTIRNRDHYMDSIWDWAILSSCFGRLKIAVSDIDGIIERHGQFLVIESKSMHAPIPVGQSIMFDHMTKMDNFKVVVIWGDALTGTVTNLREWGKETISATTDDFRQLVKEWWGMADGRRV